MQITFHVYKVYWRSGRRETCNKSAYIFFSSYSQWNPQNSFYFIFFPLFSFFSFIFLPPLQSPQVYISRFLIYITPLCSLQRKGRQTDRQQGQRHCQPKVTSSDSHTLEDLILSQKHLNFIKGREWKLICIWVHSFSSAHMFIALESPFLIPWLIKSQEGNTAQGEVRTVLLTLQAVLHWSAPFPLLRGLSWEIWVLFIP